MEIKPTQSSDVEYIVKHSTSRGEDAPPEVHFAVTVWHEDTPIIVGGFWFLTKNTAWCWMDWTDKATEHKIVAFRTVREFIDEMIEKRDIKRLMAAGHTDFQESIETMKHLGFRKESIMKNYFGDKDAYLYARIM